MTLLVISHIDIYLQSAVQFPWHLSLVPIVCMGQISLTMLHISISKSHNAGHSTAYRLNAVCSKSINFYSFCPSLYGPYIPFCKNKIEMVEEGTLVLPLFLSLRSPGYNYNYFCTLVLIYNIILQHCQSILIWNWN